MALPYFFAFCTLIAVCGGVTSPAAGKIELNSSRLVRNVPLEVANRAYFLTSDTSLGRMKLMLDTGTQATEVFTSSIHDASRVHQNSTRLIGIGRAARAVSSGQIQMSMNIDPLPRFSTNAIVWARSTDEGDPDSDGILGLDFFDSYCVQLNLPSSTMEIYPKSTCDNADSEWIALPTKWTKFGILIQIKIKFPNSKVVSTYASIDTGNNGPLLLAGKFRTTAGLDNHPNNKAKVKISGVNGAVDADVIHGCKILLGNGPGVLTGNVVLARGRFHPRASILTFQTAIPDANLGTSFLGLLNLRFDSLHKTVYMQRGGQ